jgi:hypothetical protein
LAAEADATWVFETGESLQPDSIYLNEQQPIGAEELGKPEFSEQAHLPV